MLLTLEVDNIAIIEAMALQLEGGFTVLSGETGAGKSILIEAINALIGGRTSRELVRTGTDRATVQGLFLLPPHFDFNFDSFGIPQNEDGTLLLERSFTDTGRSTCRINGLLTTVAVLKTVGERLLAIHGQHDNQSLLKEETHIDLLDAYGGPELQKTKQTYTDVYLECRRLKALWRETSGSERERKRQIDNLKFQLDELKKAALKTGEDVALEEKSRLYQHAEGILTAFTEAYTLISGEDREDAGAREQLVRAMTAVRKVAHVSDRFSALADQLADVSEVLEELGREIVDVRDNTEFDPRMRDKIEERLVFLQNIRKKYGDTIDDCILYREENQKKLDDLEGSETQLTQIQEDLHRKEETAGVLCIELHRMRTAAAERLSKGVAAHLTDLEMPKAAFETAVVYSPERDFDENGRDTVAFLFTANLGEPLKPLARIASGGEMSRVMLAMKSMLADADKISTLIFDEIDAGVGGKAAQKVGEKMVSMAKNSQILCVTHHAQIASLAEHHHYIGKESVDGRTRTTVQKLDGKEREEEITRLLSGTHRTASAHGLARELLARGLDKEK